MREKGFYGGRRGDRRGSAPDHEPCRAAFFVVLVVLTAFSALLRFGMRWFVPVLVAQSLLLAAAGGAVAHISWCVGTARAHGHEQENRPSGQPGAVGSGGEPYWGARDHRCPGRGRKDAALYQHRHRPEERAWSRSGRRHHGVSTAIALFDEAAVKGSTAYGLRRGDRSGRRPSGDPRLSASGKCPSPCCCYVPSVPVAV